ncbi:MAG: hypothetical protein AABO58_10520 [Acidobacteriota bacterium]
MTDILYTPTTLLAFLAVLALVHFFKTLDADLWHAWRNPFAAGLVIGIALRLLHLPHPIAFGLLLTFAAVYARHTGRESEAIDGMLIGAAMGAAAALPFAEPHIAAMAILAGAVAGYGITFAAFHVAERRRQLVIDAVTAIAAVGVAYLPPLVGGRHRVVLIVVAAAVPLFIVAAVFSQWPDVRAELRHEASLGFMTDADVRPTAHPLLRLGGGGWADKRAHREFVRLANKIALRKRQQRDRTDEMARLYQLEIIKLRMQIQEMSKIDRDVSDTMTGKT